MGLLFDFLVLPISGVGIKMTRASWNEPHNLIFCFRQQRVQRELTVPSDHIGLLKNIWPQSRSWGGEMLSTISNDLIFIGLPMSPCNKNRISHKYRWVLLNLNEQMVCDCELINLRSENGDSVLSPHLKQKRGTWINLSGLYGESVCLCELALIRSEQSFWRFLKLRNATVTERLDNDGVLCGAVLCCS